MLCCKPAVAATRNIPDTFASQHPQKQSHNYMKELNYLSTHIARDKLMIKRSKAGKCLCVRVHVFVCVREREPKIIHLQSHQLLKSSTCYVQQQVFQCHNTI
mgnify:CR=1 FL=1